MRAQRKAGVAFVAAVIFVGAIVFTWPLAADPAGTLPSLGDTLYNAWVLGWVASRIGHGFAGLWNAPVFFPYRATLAYAEPMLGIGVPLAPAYWLGANAVLLHNLAVWLSFVIAGTGGFLLGRDLTGSRSSGLVAGAVAAFIPYRLPQLVHVQVLMAGWLWWATWGVHRYFETPSYRRAMQVALCYTLLGLSSLYWAYIGLIPLAVVALVEGGRRRPGLTVLVRHGILALLVCAAAFWPVIRTLRRLTTDAPVLTTVDRFTYSANLTAYVTGQPTLLVWGSMLRHANGETDLFPGLTVVACGLAAIVLRRSLRVRQHDPWVWVYSGLTVLGVVLSLGPTPMAGGRVLWHNPVFPFLSTHVPGFAQLRVPARFVVVAQLALSALAALGVASWLAFRRASSRESAITGLVLASLVFVEGLGAPISVQAFSPYEAAGDRFAYQWLSEAPEGAVIELPLDGWGHRHYSLLYHYRTLLHGHAIVNGLGRFTPPLPAMLADPDSPLVAPERIGESVTFLRALGVRYVVIHRNWYLRPELSESIREALMSSAGGAGRDFGDSTIVDLGEVTSPGIDAAGDGDLPVEIPPATMAISASRGDVTRMVDGDPATRWLTGRPQGGNEWIDVGLRSALLISGARLQLMGRSLNDYPRRLEVLTSLDGEHFEPVFSGSVLPALGRALRLNPTAPVMELRWPAAAARIVRLRQTGISFRWYWSMHELRLLTFSLTSSPPGPTITQN